jgi:class 3 adenylate cyclase/tetratricopeptide (TPR) repeat protein
MRCPVCQHRSHEGARFCAECGSALAPRCGGCGVPLRADDRFCGACGRPVAAGEAAPDRATDPEREAEHRQITVAFCDLVGSTLHASKLDPEDWREVVRRFQEVCLGVVERFDGHIAQYLGDGLLVYFGYPQAHEDDAERAIRAGLGVLDAVAELNPRLAREHEIELSARIGLHTGPVVVGEIGQDGRSQMLAMGATANIAARLQAIAEPGSVVISDETLHLVPGIFVTEELGARSLKGVARPMSLHRVVRANAVRGRLALARGPLTPFVGRERELGILLERWGMVLEGEGQSVLVTGAAGIGKSRLILALRERLDRDAATWLEGRGSPYTQGSPFTPTKELLREALALSSRDSPDEQLRKLARGVERAGIDAADALPALAGLLDLPVEAAEAPAPGSAKTPRDRTIDTLTAWILALSRRQPVVLVLEDVHWFDPSSLDLLGSLIARIPASRVLALLSARPDFEPPWTARRGWTAFAIDSLRPPQARELVEVHAGGGRLAAGSVERIVERADGVPLFLEELTRAALESEAEGASIQIPATLKDSLTARLDRLGAEKKLAQLASVIGREFPYRLLEGAADAEPAVVRRGLARLVASDLLLQRGDPPEASYRFRHTLLQEAAYGSLLRAKRRALHARVAEAFESRCGERAASEPELLARHFHEAGRPAEAIRYYKRAGERDTARSATLEAIGHLWRGLELVEILPESEREREELSLRVALGPALIAACGPGDAEVGQTYLRARALCARDAPELVHVLPGIYTFHLNRGEMQAAFEVAEEQLALARRAEDPAHLIRAHWSLGQTLCLRGVPQQAVRELEQALRLFDPERDRVLSHDRSDQGVSLRSWLGWASWLAGATDRAFEFGDDAVALARRGGHPYSLAYALGFDAVLHYMAREREPAGPRAREAIAVSEQHGFPLYLAIGRLVALWADAPVSLEDEPEGRAIVELFRGALGSLRDRGAQFGTPLIAGALAEILCDAGRPAEALETVRSGLAFGTATGIRFWEPELLRIEGETLLQQDPGGARDAALALLSRAVQEARRQGTDSLERRAAASLARHAGPGPGGRASGSGPP